MKDILKKFKFKNNKIKCYKNWFLLLRENQLTLGSLVLIEKSFQTNLSKVKKKSFEELHLIISDIEKILKNLFNYKKINYLVLMMADKEVHFHIIPRYSKNIIFENLTFYDYGWPKVPNLTKINKLNEKKRKKLLFLLKKNFN